MTRLSGSLRVALIAALLTLGIVSSGVAAAQDATSPAEQAAAQVDQAAAAADDDDGGFDDWGLFGLLGLVGLAGFFRRPKAVVHESGRSGFAGPSDRIDDSGL